MSTLKHHLNRYQGRYMCCIIHCDNTVNTQSSDELPLWRHKSKGSDSPLQKSREISRIIKDLRLVPHVDKAPLPLRILRLVTSIFLPVENPTHPTAHAPERASVYILGQFRTSKWEMNMYWKLRRFATLSFRYKAFQILLLLVISILIIFSMYLDFDVIMWRYLSKWRKW